GISAGSLYAEAQQATVAGETDIWVGGDATLKGDFTVVGTADMAIKAHEDSDVYVEGSLLFSGKNGDENYWYAIDAKNFIFNGTTLAGTGDGGIRGSESISITAQTVDIEADYDRALSSLVVRINSDQVRLVSNGLDVEEDDIGIYRAALYYGSELTMNVTDAYICGCRGIDSWGHDGVATIDGNVTVVGTKSNAITVYGAMTASGSLTLRSEKEYKEAVGYAAIYAHTFTFDGDTFVVESVSQGVRVYGSPLSITAKNVIIRSERRNGIYAVYGLTLRADRGTISGTTAIYAQEQALLYSDNLVLESTDSRSSGIWCENGSVLLSGNIVINTNGWYGINADKDVTFERGYYKITGPKGNAQAVKVGDEGDLYVHASLQIVEPDGGHINGNVINGAGDSPAMELLMYAPVGTVDIYVSTPSDGLYPIFDSSVVYGLPPLCSFDSIVWFENGVQMAEGTPFTAGNTYSVEIILSAADGYYFANGVLAKVNGKNSSMTGTVDNNTKLMIRADMGTCANAITQVNLSVATPVEGNKPSTSVTDNEKGYGVDSDDVRWMVSTDGVNYTPMAAGAKFEGGKYYRMVTEVQTIGNNYSFKITDKNGSVVPDVQATVNGKPAKVEKTYDQDPEKIITVSVDFGMCNDFMIEQIVLVDVVEPVAGQRPSYKANAFGTGYHINTEKNAYTDVYWLNPAEKWYYIKNGIGWYDVTKDDWVYEHEVFIAGHEYRCIVYVDTDDGYEFAHDKWYEIQITATINGNTAAFKEAGSDYAWHQQISCGFVCEEPQYTPGDVNNDGDVNVRDLGLLQQYLNDYDVTLNLDAADVTGDGEVNVRDYGLLQQYLNDYDVELK
ncbi:MAG: dockerin type I repeat-containing protein, partial [Clostridia bacterium]|nr:dockerin type I repeat-containing protein [Clostridia bacterium]